MTTRTFSRFAGLMALTAMLFCAQPTLAQEDSTTVDELTISGQKPQTREEKIDKFVETATVKTPTGQIGRWDKEICVSIDNIKPEYADAIQGRITSMALELGLTTGPPGCKPNIFILGTIDGNAATKQLIKDHKKFFRDDEWTISVGQDKLEKFASSNLPVRSWFVVKRVTRDGKPYRVGSTIEGRGRIGSTVRADFSHAFLVVDVSRIEVSLVPLLPDYVAMVALSQINLEAELPEVPTVLNIFTENAERPSGLTDWDHGYLRGLYSAKRDAKRAAVQKYQISNTMEASQSIQ